MKTLKDVMSHDVEVVSPEATLFDVATKMKLLDTGVLPVCDGNKISGMITDRDLVVRALASSNQWDRLSQVTAREVMTRGTHYCYQDESLTAVAEKMQKQQVRRLIVVDRDKQLVGIVSLGDLSAGTSHLDLAAKTLSQVSRTRPRSAAWFLSGSILFLTGAVFGAFAWYRRRSNSAITPLDTRLGRKYPNETDDRNFRVA